VQLIVGDEENQFGDDGGRRLLEWNEVALGE
jgi:hypothetical protein